MKKTGEVKVHINCNIKGEPAQILLELKERGLVNSNKDAINQGLCALYNKILERDLKTKQLKEFHTGWKNPL